VQLQDSNGNDVRVGLDGRRPAEWTLTEELLQDANVDGDPDSPSDVKFRNTRTVRSDSRGQVSFSVSEQRPSTCTANSCTRTFKLTELSNAPPVAVNSDPVQRSFGRSDGDVYYLEFSSAAPILANSVVRLTVPDPYINVPDRGDVGNTAIVTVHNEYGEALSAATARLESNRTTNLTAQRFTIGRDGVHRFSYSYSGNGGVVETITATVDPDGNGSEVDLTATDDRPLTGHMFWAGLADRTSGGTKYTILFGDIDRNEIIVDANATADGVNWPGTNTEPVTIEYDDNDRLDALGQAFREGSAGVDAFERVLAQFLAKTPTDDTGTGACLEWANFNRARDTAEIELFDDTNCPGT